MKINTQAIIEQAEKKLETLHLEELKAAGILPLDDSYVPTIMYPTYTIHFPLDEKKIFKDIPNNKFDPFALYIHIPFCEKFCQFCQYDTFIKKDSKNVDLYLHYLEKEIKFWKKRLNKKTLTPTALFIGGGTPSLLSPAQMKSFFLMLYSHLDLKKCHQISIDLEPKTISEKDGINKLNILKKFNVERVCLGAQSFDDQILKRMNRPHNSKDIKTAIAKIKKVGMTSLSLDLIFGYPECPAELWIKTLKEAISWDIDAYQLYQLRTIGFRVRRKDNNPIINKHQNKPEIFLNDKQIYLLKIIGQIISKFYGFKAVGRGAFVKNTSHNSQYLINWCCKGHNLLGLGIGSGSMVSNSFFKNTGESLEKYYSYLNNGVIPIHSGQVISQENVKRRNIILPLKNCGYVSKKQYHMMTGGKLPNDFNQTFKKLKSFGLIAETADKIKFTEKGAIFADQILIHLYDPQYIPIKKESYKNTKYNPYKTHE